MILAIDPGNIESAFVLYDPVNRKIRDRDTLPNHELLDAFDHFLALPNPESQVCAIEMVASYGMAVGAEVFETVFWIGRFAERWHARNGNEAHRVFRKAVKLHLCGNYKAKDANVRQALIDMFSAGAGKDVAIGKKSSPGPLFGVSGDQWAALAVAVTFAAGPTSGRP